VQPPPVPEIQITNYSDPKKKRYECVIDGEPVDLERVTSLLNGLPKPGLTYGQVWGTIDAALDRAPTFAEDVSADRKQVRKELYGAVFEQWALRREIGTAVHRQVESRILGGRAPLVPHDVDGVEVGEILVQFDRFCDAFSPEWEASELMVISTKHKYAGTLDTIVTVQTDNGPRRLLVDIKCTKRESKTNKPGVWLDQACQMSAYVNAEWCVDAKAGIVEPVPDVDGAAILWLHREEWALVELDVGDRVFDLFLAGAYVYRTQGDAAKNADGENAKWWKIETLRGANG